MSTQKPKQSRRDFIRRSAFAAGIVGGGGTLIGNSFSAANDHHRPPPVNPNDYPWSVKVGGSARASLYLLGSRPLGELLLGPFSSVLLQMKNRRAFREPNHSDRSKLDNELRGRADSDKLRQRLVRAHLAMQRVPDGHPTSYFELAMWEVNQWDPELRDALTHISQAVLVPLLDVDRDIVRSIDPARIEAYGSRSLRELFTLRYDQVDSDERALWHEVRRARLIWCAPRHYLGNGWRCSPTTHKCVDGNDDDYCQEVDGACNAIST